MTLDEYLKQARLFAEVTIDCSDNGHDCEPAPKLMLAKNTLKLLAIIEAQRAELEKLDATRADVRARYYACSVFFDNGLELSAFGGNAAIEARFEKGEL